MRHSTFLPWGCGEDLGEGADGLRWVGDAVVEDEDGAGGRDSLRRVTHRRRSVFIWLGFPALTHWANL